MIKNAKAGFKTEGVDVTQKNEGDRCSNKFTFTDTFSHSPPTLELSLRKRELQS
ncbi:MAG: hypothetical protein H7333_11490 [Bdellovibrionales bacterium]|nr:hypothetical protein [Oligoflexia bacterium]